MTNHVLCAPKVMYVMFGEIPTCIFDCFFSLAAYSVQSWLFVSCLYRYNVLYTYLFPSCQITENIQKRTEQNRTISLIRHVLIIINTCNSYLKVRGSLLSPDFSQPDTLTHTSGSSPDFNHFVRFG